MKPRGGAGGGCPHRHAKTSAGHLIFRRAHTGSTSPSWYQEVKAFIVKPYHDYDVLKAPKPIIDLEQLGFICIYCLLDCEK